MLRQHASLRPHEEERVSCPPAGTLGLLKQLVLGAGSVETMCCFKSLRWETNISTRLNDFLAAKCLSLKKNEAG